MRTINVRELRNEIPRLRETLAAEHELVLVSNGEPIARILPAQPAPGLRPKLPSLKALRETMPLLTTSIEATIRQERNRR